MIEHICQYCGLPTAPFNYHEGASDCQQNMRDLSDFLRNLVAHISPTDRAWEIDPDFGIPSRLLAALSNKLGLGFQYIADDCTCGIYGPAMQHAQSCPCRLSFHGGDPAWGIGTTGQIKTLANGRRYTWCYGTWYPVSDDYSPTQDD